MKTIEIQSVIVFILSCTLFLTSYGGSSSQKATYTCPMHPDIKSDKVGDCPS